MRHGMGGFCCGVGELEISSGEASQQTEVKRCSVISVSGGDQIILC